MELSPPATNPLERLGEPTHTTLGSRGRQALLWALLVFGDSIALGIAFEAAYLLRFQNPLLPYLSPFSETFYSQFVFWAIPLWLVVFMLYRLYDLALLFGGIDEYARIAQACTLGIIVLIVYSFVDRRGDSSDLSRLWLVFVWLLCIAFVTAERFILRRVVYDLRRRGYLRRRVLIVGANPEGEAIADQLQHAVTTGLEVVGFVDDHAPAALTPHNLPVLGGTKDLRGLVSRRNIDEIIIASTAVTREQLLETYQAFGLSDTVELRLSPGLFEILTTGARIKESGYVPLVSLNRLRITGVDAWLKKALDWIFIVLVSPLLMILFIVIGALIKLDSQGPIIHRRRVLGVGGRPFDAFKFRTMASDADSRLAQLLATDPAARAEYERNRKLTNDPRITRLGWWLRRTSLDELPQVINVLVGQMSLIGPRMIAPDEIELYGKWWMNLLTVKPGITGPWQVMGRNELPYDERVRLSMRYIRNHTVWLDLQILYQTIAVIFKGA